MSSFQRFIARVVLLAFVFQTLWPSVVFARVEVPLGSGWREDPFGLTLKVSPYKDEQTQRDLVRVQAYINQQEDWGEQVEGIPQTAGAPSVPPSSKITTPSDLPSAADSKPAASPKPAVSDAFKKLLDRVVDIRTFQSVASDSAYALYNDLTVKEEGISWSFGGLAFVLDWQWNIATTGTSGFDMAVKVCTKGNVSLDNVSVKQMLAKGKDVVVRGAGKIERLDVWATGETGKAGTFRITEDSNEAIQQLYLHQGKGENNGQLTIGESFQQTEQFENKGTLLLGKGASVKGGQSFSNFGTVDGKDYTLQSHLIRNQSVGDKKATIKASENLTLETKKLEQKGIITSSHTDLSKVEQIEDDSTAVLKADRLKTAFKHSWEVQGGVEAKDWQDSSHESVSILNQGTVITHKKTSLAAQFQNGDKGKADLSGVDFKNVRDLYKPLVNAGQMTLRRVHSLGAYHRKIENRQNASLTFWDCGHSSKYGRDEKGVPFWGGLHLGKVTNAGTIGLGKGTYRLHGDFTNTETGIQNVLEGQELWVKDLINDGEIKAPKGYRIDQRLGIFTKLGKVLVKGKLITQISEQAVRQKTGDTTWKHTGHLEADDWVDESDMAVKIENEGTIITRKSATLAAQFETGTGGKSDLTGLTLAKPLTTGQTWENKGETILRKVKSLGEAKRSIVNEKNGKLAFLEGIHSEAQGDSQTQFRLGDLTNYGVMSFGGGEYHTGIFINHHIHEALSGQKLRVQDFINHGETRSTNGYLIDMKNRAFSKLGRMVVKGGPTTLQFASTTNAGEYLTDNRVQDWDVEELKIEADLFHNTADWLLKAPFYLEARAFLNDAAIHTHGFFAKLKTFTQGTSAAPQQPRFRGFRGRQIGAIAGRLGEIKSSAKVDIEVEGDVDNRWGKIEAAEGGEVTSKQGDILIGKPIGWSGYRLKNGAFIFAHKGLQLNARNILMTFGEAGSKEQLNLNFQDKLVLESARIQAMGKTTFQGKSVTIKRTAPYISSEAFNDSRFWHNQWQEREGGDRSQVLIGDDLSLLVDNVEIVASDIAVMGDISDKGGQKLTKDNPGIIKLTPLDYRRYAEKIGGGFWLALFGRPTPGAYKTEKSTFSASGQVDLSFEAYQLAGLVMTAASVLLNGESFMLGGNTSSTSGGTAAWGRVPLLPAILRLANGATSGFTQYRSPSENPYVVYSTGSFFTNVIDPSLMTLVSDALTNQPRAADPLADFLRLRQLADQDALVYALQVTLAAATHKSYLFARKDAKAHVRLLLENAQKLKQERQFLARAEAGKAQEPMLTFEIERIDGEEILVPYLYIPQNFINQHLFETSRGTLAAEEGVTINMSRFLGDLGGVMATQKKDIKLKSQGDMNLGAAADGHQEGKNYHETKVGGAFYADEGDLNAVAEGDLNRSGIHVEAVNASFEAGGNGVDAALPLHSHSVVDHEDGETVTDRVKPAVSTYDLQGDYTEHFGGNLDTYAPHVKAAAARTTAAEVREHPVHETVHQTMHRKDDGGILGGSHEVHEEHFSAQAQGSVFKLKKPREVTATHGNITLEGVNYQVPRTILNAPNGAIQLLAAKSVSQTVRMEKSADAVWQTMSQDAESHQIHQPCQFSGEVVTHSKDDVLVEQVQGKTLEWLKRLELNGGELTVRDLADMHLSQHFEAEGPTAACGLVVAIAVTMLTSGTGTGLGLAVTGVADVAAATTAQAFVIGATQAAFTGICSSAAVSLLQNQGDIGKTVKDILKKENLKSIAISAVINGATLGMGKVLGTPGSGMEAAQRAKKAAEGTAQAAGLSAPTLAMKLEAGLRYHLQHQAVKTAVSMAVKMGVGEKPEDVFKMSAKGLVAGVIGAVVANRLSEAADVHAAEPLNPVIHKLLHAGLGALTGAIVDGEKGAKAAALGAFVAETVADLLKDDIDVIGQRVQEKAQERGIALDDEARIAALVQEEMGKTIDLARLSAALAALLTNQDVNIADMAGTNAVENNSLQDDIRHAMASIYNRGIEILQAVPRDVLLKAADYIEKNPDGIEIGIEMLFGGLIVNQDDRGAGAKAAFKTPHDRKAEQLNKQALKAALKACPQILRKWADKIGKPAATVKPKVAPTAKPQGIPADAKPTAEVPVPKPRSAGKKADQSVQTESGAKPEKKVQFGEGATPSTQTKGPDTEAKAPATRRELLPGEGQTGAYGELNRGISKPGDNLSAHHLPHDNFMRSQGVKRTEGVAIMVEDPVPGKAGRHRTIHRELKKQDPTLAPRQALAQGVARVKEVYKQDGVYTPEIRKGLQDAIELNKRLHPHLFEKP